MPASPKTARERRPTAEVVRIVADVGGTNARFATVGDSPRDLERLAVFPCERYPRIGDAIKAYLNRYDIESVDELCLAVAGPVFEESADLPNSTWSFNRRALEEELGIPIVLINDFTAQVLSIDLLQDDELVWLGAPRPLAAGIRTVIGPGTGLGVAVRMPNGSVVPSEGGHIAFAPTNEHEIEILRALYPRYRRVSAERLLSGPGLENLFRANCEIHGVVPAQECAPRSAEDVTSLAGEGDPVALRAVEDFLDILATFAGDAALFAWSTAGVYLSGGVLQKLAAFLDVERFRARFEDKGRFTRFCETVPVARITHHTPGLLGGAVALNEGWSS